jgi:hypothetical protein
MSKKDGGCERLLKALQAGQAIDPLAAWAELGIYRLAARIHDLKTKRGVTGIKKSSRYVTNRFGEKAGPVAVYTLEKDGVLVA